MKKQLNVTQDYQLVNAKYKLNTNEIKFIMIAISQIDSVKNDDFLDEYTIKLSDLEQTLQTKQNKTHLKTFAKKLMSKPLEVPLEDGFEIFNWFSKIRYKEGIFTVRIDKDLKPYLLKLKERFVSYNLKYILPLTSTYSVRIYQFLKEYEKLQVRHFDVDELQELLQVPKSYISSYKDFKKNVLKVAERELKEHTDIYFTLIEEKEGRKITKLIFKIHQNINNKVTNPQIALEDDNPLNKYMGENANYKNSFYDEIMEIIPFKDGSIKVTFKSGLGKDGWIDRPIIRFQSESELIEAIKESSEN